MISFELMAWWMILTNSPGSRLIRCMLVLMLALALRWIKWIWWGCWWGWCCYLHLGGSGRWWCWWFCWCCCCFWGWSGRRCWWKTCLRSVPTLAVNLHQLTQPRAQPQEILSFHSFKLNIMTFRWEYLFQASNWISWLWWQYVYLAWMLSRYGLVYITIKGSEYDISIWYCVDFMNHL